MGRFGIAPLALGAALVGIHAGGAQAAVYKFT